MKQKCWQTLLFGASFINWSNSLRWYVLPQAFETIKLGFLAVREDHWHRPCLEIPVCVCPGAVWHHTDGDRLGARPACLFQAADEDIWEAAFHPQFPCPLPTWTPLGTSPPIMLKGGNAWYVPATHTPGSDSLTLQSAAKKKGQAGGNTQGALENPIPSAAVPGASVAAKARVPHHPCKHRSIKWRPESVGCLLGLCVLLM